MNTRNLLIPAVSTPRGRGRCNGRSPPEVVRIRVPASSKCSAFRRERTLEGSTGCERNWRSLHLGGTFDFEVNPRKMEQDWVGRANVFSGMPSAVYLPISTSFTVTRCPRLRPGLLLLPSGRRPSSRAHSTRGCARRNSRRRQRHSPDQSHPYSRIFRSTPPDRRGLYAERKLVQLSSPQTRCAQSARGSGPRGTLLLQDRSAGRVCDSAGIHARPAA